MIGIFNKTEEKIEKKFIRDIVKYTFKKLNVGKCEVNIIFVGINEIHEINKSFRGIDRPTDVISFALEDNDDMCMSDERILGDIYICMEKIHEQAKEYGHSEKREMAFLTVHGLLHLLGYDHMEKEEEKIMFNLQEEILDELGIRR